MRMRMGHLDMLDPGTSLLELRKINVMPSSVLSF